MKTHFAPAERTSHEDVLAQHAHFMRSMDLSLVGETVTDMIAVLNEQRQIVYANPAMTEFAERMDIPDTCGLRPGELLGCIHSQELIGGCGTSPSCRFCGAGTAIVDAMSNSAQTNRECVIALPGSGEVSDLSFDVSVVPFAISEKPFVFVYFRDTRDRKQRLALERVFFHDILNTASSLKVYVDLMKRDGETHGYIGTLNNIAHALIEEIESHKIIAYAESGTLSLQEHLISSYELAESVAGTFAHDPLLSDKCLLIDPDAEHFGFVSDETLVRRILSNMVRNALEACTSGDEVYIHFQRDDQTVTFSVTNPGIIPADIRSRIFTRFFSTKGENRGLGTFGMRLLAERYLGGRVILEPDTEGTITFSLSLPNRRLEKPTMIST